MPASIGVAVASAVGSFLFSVGVPLVLVNAAVFAAPFLVSAAVSVGLSLAANLIFRPGAATPASVKPSDGQQAIRQPVPARWKSPGRVRLAGPVWWWAAAKHTIFGNNTSDFYIGLY